MSKEKLFEKVFKRDGLLKFLQDEIEFINNEEYSWSKKYTNKDEVIDAYKSFIEIVKEEDEPSTEYMVEIFKEKNGDELAYSTSIKESIKV